MYRWTRRWWVGPLLGLVTVFVAAEKQRSQDWSGIVSIAAEGVFRLESMAGEQMSRCSAVLIATEIVSTAAHCIPIQPHGRSITVNRRDAEILAVNYVLDLAVLKVKRLKGRVLTLRANAAPIGLPIAAIGYAFGAERVKPGFGWVSDIDDDSVVVGLLADINLIPGASGGAIVDMHGQLITIVQGFIASGAHGLGVGPTPEVFQRFTEEWRTP